MKMPIGRVLVAILLLAAILLMSGFAAPVGATPLDDATAAAESGDYAKAIELLRPSADKGDRDAQYNLGIMYFTGQGVLRDAIALIGQWTQQLDRLGII